MAIRRAYVSTRSTAFIAAAFLSAACALASGAPKEPPRDEATFQAMLKAAREPNRDVRCEAAWALGRMGREEAAPALEALAADPVAEVRATALSALAELLPHGSRVAVKLPSLENDPATRRAALVAAKDLLFDQRDALIAAALASEAPLDRTLALDALQLTPPAAARPPAEAALKDAAPQVRAAALRALGLCSGPEAAGRIASFLAEKSSSESFLVRAAACDGLRELKLNKAGAPLRAATADEHFLVRRAAIRAIIETRDPAGLPSIQSRIAESDYTVRLAVCAALGEFVDATSAPPLAKRLADDVPEVRDAAMAALAGFPPEMVFDSLAEYLDDTTRADSRRRAWTLLGGYGYPPSVEVAFAHLRDEDAVVLGNALRIMRKLSDRRAIPRVLELLTFTRDKQCPPDPAGEEAFRMAILFELKEPIPSAMYALQLTANPPMGMQPFMPTAPVAEWSVHYLAAFDQKQAVPLLEKIYAELQDDVPGLARATAAALEKLTGRPHPHKPLAQPPIFGHYFIDGLAPAGP